MPIGTCATYREREYQSAGSGVVAYDLDDGLMDKPDMTVKVGKQLKLLIYLCADCKRFLVGTDQLVDADPFTTVEYEFRTGINIRKKLGA